MLRQRRYILRNVSHEASNSAFLLLPAYFDFLRIFIFYIFLVTVINLSAGHVIQRPLGFSLQIGIFHFFFDGLWFFFSQFGAGSKAFARSFWFGFCSACASTLVFLYVARNLYSSDNNMWFPLFLAYNLTYTAIFALPLVAPASVIYRRPPMHMYSTVMCAYHFLYTFFIILLRLDVNSGYCIAVFVYVLFDCILKPVCVVLALAIDSAYWQGTNSAHPLAGIWTVDANIATSIANVDTKQLTVPFLHFGMISLDKDVGFVAGGFSRVYFGKIRDTKVALKMLFVLELTPGSISDFCREAELMHTLRHPNIISCMGVCIMPPAVSIVLEFCSLGSLYDVIYKNRNKHSSLFGYNLRSTIFRSGIVSNFSSHNTRSSMTSNPMSDQDQFELRASTLRTSRSRVSDLSVRSVGPDGARPAPAATPLASADSLQPLRPLDIESRAGLALSWESLSLLCEELDGHFPFDIDMQPLLRSSQKLDYTEAKKTLRSSVTGTVVQDETEKLAAPVKRKSSTSPLWGQHLSIQPVDFAEATTMDLEDALPGDLNDSIAASGSALGGRFTSIFHRRSSKRGSMSYPGNTGSVTSKPGEQFARSIYNAPPRSQLGNELYRTDIPLYLLEGLPLIHNLSVRGIIEVLCDITRGLAYLHLKEYKHCDIKSLNFLLTENFRVKLADFGESKRINTVVIGESRPPVPALNWCPPGNII